MGIGGPIFCYFADRSGRHLQLVLFSAVFMSAAFGALLSTSISPALLTVLFSMIGVCCAYQMLMIYKVSTLAGRESAGLSTAIANMVIMAFGYIFHSIIGKVVGALGGFEDAPSLSAGVAVIPIALALTLSD